MENEARRTAAFKDEAEEEAEVTGKEKREK